MSKRNNTESVIVAGRRGQAKNEDSRKESKDDDNKKRQKLWGVRSTSPDGYDPKIVGSFHAGASLQALSPKYKTRSLRRKQAIDTETASATTKTHSKLVTVPVTDAEKSLLDSTVNNEEALDDLLGTNESTTDFLNEWYKSNIPVNN